MIIIKFEIMNIFLIMIVDIHYNYFVLIGYDVFNLFFNSIVIVTPKANG